LPAAPPLALPPLPFDGVEVDEHAMSANAKLPASRARGARLWGLGLADGPKSSRAARYLVESMCFLQGANEGRVPIPT
jgi:hypothetical protein